MCYNVRSCGVCTEGLCVGVLHQNSDLTTAFDVIHEITFSSIRILLNPNGWSSIVFLEARIILSDGWSLDSNVAFDPEVEGLVTTVTDSGMEGDNKVVTWNAQWNHIFCGAHNFILKYTILNDDTGQEPFEGYYDVFFHPDNACGVLQLDENGRLQTMSSSFIDPGFIDGFDKTFSTSTNVTMKHAISFDLKTPSEVSLRAAKLTVNGGDIHLLGESAKDWADDLELRFRYIIEGSTLELVWSVYMDPNRVGSDGSAQTIRSSITILVYTQTTRRNLMQDGGISFDINSQVFTVMTPDCDLAVINPVAAVGDLILPGTLIEVACPTGFEGEKTVFCGFDGWDESLGEDNCIDTAVNATTIGDSESSSQTMMFAGAGGLAAFCLLAIACYSYRK
eukprot:TRINITY_DN861_c0_g1_i5.p1 TRINITY_DN861_c0_g1~~TRINITY_DN861_c0_g1_i5.p1  ORF type:complete len:393 (-),score=55.23 TRINITY_DN861_c0_g1_i5:152-1330(-)